MAVAPRLISWMSRTASARPALVLLQHHRVRRELLAQGHRHRVLKLGAPHLEDVAELLGLGREGLAQDGHRVEQFPYGDDRGDVDGRRVDVVRRLAQVDMLVGVQMPVVALVMAQDLQGPVGDHLVGVHVRRGPGAALDDIDDELVVQLPAGPDLPAGGGDRVGPLRVEQPEVLVGPGRGLLDGGERIDQVRVGGDRRTGDGEVLDGAQGVHAPVRLGGYLPVAEQIVFAAVVEAAVMVQEGPL